MTHKYYKTKALQPPDVFPAIPDPQESNTGGGGGGGGGPPPTVEELPPTVVGPEVTVVVDPDVPEVKEVVEPEVFVVDVVVVVDPDDTGFVPSATTTLVPTTIVLATEVVVDEVVVVDLGAVDFVREVVDASFGVGFGALAFVNLTVVSLELVYKSILCVAVYVLKFKSEEGLIVTLTIRLEASLQNAAPPAHTALKLTSS